MANNTYEVEYAKTGRSGCKNKKCELGKVIDQGSVRIGKVHPSPFSEGDTMADWFHPACFFDAMLRALAKTPVPMSADDIKGWELLEAEDEAKLEPLLKEFINLRKAKLAGTLPKKPKTPKATAAPVTSTPKASATKAPVADADWFTPTSAPTPTKKAPASTPTPKNADAHGLVHMLDNLWYPILSPLINAMHERDEMLSTFGPFVPNKAHLFESLRGLLPSSVNLIIIDNKTSFLKPNSASGYPFNDAADKSLQTANSTLSSFLHLCRSYNNAQGFNVDWESYNTRAPISWFEAMKKQGVLFLHRELSSDPNSVAPSTVWDALVLKIIKTVFQTKEKQRSGGIVIALFGNGLTSLKRNLERVHSRFFVPSNAVPIRFVTSPMPDDPAFTAEDNNPFEMIDTFLAEMDSSPISWFPEKEGPISMPVDAAPVKPSAAAKSSSTSSNSGKPSHPAGGFPPAPVLSGKITSRLQLTSMDSKADLDIGKLHRDPNSKGTFLLRALDLNPADPNLSSHIATFTITDAKNITITRSATNPIFVLSGDKASALDIGSPFPLKRGDVLSFAGEEYSYRLDPYNFDNPPQNRYQIENSSVHSSMHEDDDLGPRVNEAKRPLSEVEFGSEPLAAPPTKKSKPKSAALDWMDDENDDDGIINDGDGDYKPPKHGETVYDHIIDDGEGANSEDEEKFFADNRPICMYGSTCYRKNPAHLAQFKHPPK